MRIGSSSLSFSNYNQALVDRQKTMLRIATAQRINNAADDAVSLTISEGLRGQINGLNQAYGNTQDSISMLNTADDGMDSSTDTLQRMRELTVNASNGTLTDQDRSSIQQEMSQLSAQLNSNANNTEFNTIKTNDGSLNNLSIQTGANSGQNMSISIGNVSTSALSISDNVSTQSAAVNSLDSIDKAIDKLSSFRGNIGATANSLEYSSDIVSQSAANLQDAESRYRDADLTKESTLFDKSNIQLYASMMAMSKNMQNLQQSTLSIFA